MNKRFNIVGLDTTDGALTHHSLKKEDEQLATEWVSVSESVTKIIWWRLILM